jgi:hypothetical protein
MNYPVDEEVAWTKPAWSGFNRNRVWEGQPGFRKKGGVLNENFE